MERPELSTLRQAFEALAPLPDAEWAHASRGAVLQELPRGAALLRQGEPVEWLGYLARGLIRIHRHAGEHEVTLGFDCEGRFVGAYDAFVTRTRAQYALQTLEPSLLVRFERAQLAELETRHPCWRELFRCITERELVRKIDKELRIRTRTPEERYAELLRKGSFLVRRAAVPPGLVPRHRPRDAQPHARAHGRGRERAILIAVNASARPRG